MILNVYNPSVYEYMYMYMNMFSCCVTVDSISMILHCIYSALLIIESDLE